MIRGIIELGKLLIGGVKTHFENRQKIKQAEVENRIRLVQSKQSHNQSWEIKSLSEAGWKDDALFFCWLGFFIYSGVDPAATKIIFDGWATAPAWFIEVSGWLIGSVIGVRALGSKLPSLISGIKGALGKNSGDTRPD